MKMTCALLLVLSLIFSAAIIQAADPRVEESFYRSCIDQKIKSCELKARLVNSKGERTRSSGQSALEQARFLDDRKEELIQAMAQQNLEKKRYKVDHFLNTTYSQAAVNADSRRAAGLRAAE